MTGVHRILDMVLAKKNLKTTIAPSIYFPKTRKSDARFLADKLGIPLRDSLPEVLQIMTNKVSIPAAIVLAPNGTALILDALTGRDPQDLMALIERHVLDVMQTPSVDVFKSQRLSCLDTLTIPTLQSLNDSLMLAYDRLRERVMIVNWRQDTIRHVSTLPTAVRNQYRTSEGASEWDALEKAGVEMTSVTGGYVPTLDNNRVVLGITQRYFVTDTTTAVDDSKVQMGRFLGGRVARWPDNFKATPWSDAIDTAYAMNTVLNHNAPQRIDGVTVFSCSYAYSTTNPDSQFIAGYADANGEHPLVTGLMLRGGDTSATFEYRMSLTEISAMTDGKMLISSYANNIFGTFDTTEKRFTPLRMVGALALTCSAATGASDRTLGFYGPYLLVDRDRNLFYAITPRWDFPYPEEATPYALALHAYNTESGKLEYIKWYKAPTPSPLAGLQPFHIQDGKLFVFCQDDDEAHVLMIPL